MAEECLLDDFGRNDLAWTAPRGEEVDNDKRVVFEGLVEFSFPVARVALATGPLMLIISHCGSDTPGTCLNTTIECDLRSNIMHTPTLIGSLSSHLRKGPRRRFEQRSVRGVR